MRWYINRGCWLFTGVWLVGFSYAMTSGQNGLALWMGLLVLLSVLCALASEDFNE